MSYPSCFNNVVCIPLRLLGAVPSIAQNDILLHLFSSFFFHLVNTLRDYLGSTATTTQLSCPFRGGTLTGTIAPKDDIAVCFMWITDAAFSLDTGPIKKNCPLDPKLSVKKKINWKNLELFL